MKKRYLGVDEANLHLPYVARQMMKLIKLNQLLEIMENIEIIYENDYEYFEADMKKNKAIYKLSHDFYQIIEELFQMGFLVKDIDSGIVDIHSMHEGRPIYLIWKVGEKSINYWHEVDSEYASMQPVSSLNKEAHNK